jgi:hypothetical protein
MWVKNREHPGWGISKGETDFRGADVVSRNQGSVYVGYLLSNMYEKHPTSGFKRISHGGSGVMLVKANAFLYDLYRSYINQTSGIKKATPKDDFSCVDSFTINTLRMASPRGFEPLLPP